MTEKEYISKLRSKLRYSLPQSEIREICSDMEEVFSDGLADGRNEGEICLSLGSPADAAKAILAERSISVPFQGKVIRWAAFVFVAAFYSYLLWKEYVSFAWLMPFAALGLLLIITGGRLGSLAEEKGNALSVISTVLTIVPIPVFVYLVLSFLPYEGAGKLVVIGLFITALTAAGLICSLRSVRASSIGKMLPVIGGVCIGALVFAALYACFGLMNYYADPWILAAYCGKYASILLNVIYISLGLELIALAIKKDRFTLPCFYAIMGSMTLVSRLWTALRSVDPAMKAIKYRIFLPTSLVVSIAGIVLLAAAANVWLIRSRRRKAE